MLTPLEAIAARHSVRHYRPEPLTAQHRAALLAEVDECNRLSGLHIQLVTDEPHCFHNWKTYGSFSGVRHYLVMAGRKEAGLDERVGYYGERLVIFMQQHGISSCWAGVSYRKVAGTFTLLPGEKVVCMIALGYDAGRPPHKHGRRSVQQVSNADAATPAWFERGVQAALLAPTAVNQQKFYLAYRGLGTDGRHRIEALRRFSWVGYTRVDIGIVKFHFETATAPHRIAWESDPHHEPAE